MTDRTQISPVRKNTLWLVSIMLYLFLMLFGFPIYFYLRNSDFLFQIGIPDYSPGNVLLIFLIAIFVACIIYNISVLKTISTQFIIGFVGFGYILLLGTFFVFSGGGNSIVSISKCQDYKIIARSSGQSPYGPPQIEILAQKQGEYEQIGFGGDQTMGKPSIIVLNKDFWATSDFELFFGLKAKGLYLIDNSSLGSLSQYYSRGIKEDSLVSSATKYQKSDIFNPYSNIYTDEEDKLNDINYWQSKDFQKFVSCVDKDILDYTYLNVQ